MSKTAITQDTQQLVLSPHTGSSKALRSQIHACAITWHTIKWLLPHFADGKSGEEGDGKGMSTTSWHCHGCLPSTSIRIKSCATEAADFQYPLKEFRVESRSEALCVPRKLAGHVFRQIFLGADFMSPVLISSHIQRSTKILHMTTVPCHQHKLHEINRNFLKIKCA